jgi:hypothetical protein
MNRRQRIALTAGILASGVALFVVGIEFNLLGRYLSPDPPWLVIARLVLVVTLCIWPVVIRPLVLGVRAALALALSGALALGMVASDCGTGGSAYGEACVTDSCTDTISKLDYFEEAVTCSREVLDPAARAILALRCLSTRPLRYECAPAGTTGPRFVPDGSASHRNE